MKSKITCLLAVCLLCINTAFSQLKAKVSKVNGIEVYILSEPLRNYEVVNNGGKGIQWGSFITGGLINESISTKISKYIRKLLKGYKKEGIKFDAVVYSNGKNMTAIKFTEPATKENNRIAEITKIDGIPFFVMSEPIKDYTHEKTIGGGIKWKSALTAGLVNNSIEQDLMKFAKKGRRKYKKGKINAIRYSKGKKAEGILIKDI